VGTSRLTNRSPESAFSRTFIRLRERRPLAKMTHLAVHLAVMLLLLAVSFSNSV